MVKHLQAFTPLLAKPSYPIEPFSEANQQVNFAMLFTKVQQTISSLLGAVLDSFKMEEFLIVEAQTMDKIMVYFVLLMALHLNLELMMKQLISYRLDERPDSKQEVDLQLYSTTLVGFQVQEKRLSVSDGFFLKVLIHHRLGRSLSIQFS